MCLASYICTLYRIQCHLRSHVFPRGLEIRICVIIITSKARIYLCPWGYNNYAEVIIITPSERVDMNSKGLSVENSCKKTLKIGFARVIYVTHPEDRWSEGILGTLIYTHTHTHTHTHIHIYIYIYRERERDEQENDNEENMKGDVS